MKVAWGEQAKVGFLSQSEDVQVRLIGYSEFPIVMNVDVSGCLSLYVGPVMKWLSGKISGYR